MNESRIGVASVQNKAFVSYLVSEYSGITKSYRRRDSLPQEEQLRRIAKAQLKRERKAKRNE